MITPAVIERLECTEREKFDFAGFMRESLPSLPRAVVGSLTVADISRGPRQTRYLVDETMWPWTPAQWARAWLGLCVDYGRSRRGVASRRVPWRKELLPMLAWPAPIHFGGPMTGDLVYVDLDSAYYHLYQSLSLDVDYRPDGRDTRVGLGRFRFVGAPEVEDKAVRRCASGIFRTTKPLVIYRRGEATQGPPGTAWNRFLAPGLWGVMCDSLHAIAARAVEVHRCAYWHTDGGIMPAEEVGPFLAWLARDWHLTASVRAQGPGKVTGLSRWVIGEQQSARQGKLRPTSNLRQIDPKIVPFLCRIR